MVNEGTRSSWGCVIEKSIGKFLAKSVSSRFDWRSGKLMIIGAFSDREVGSKSSEG